MIRGFTFTCFHSNNIVQLRNGKIFVIESILTENCMTEENIDDFYIHVRMERKRKTIFDFHTSSIDVGVMEILSWKEDKLTMKIENLDRKCVLLNMNNAQYVLLR